MSCSPHAEDSDKQHAQTEAEMAALFASTMTLIASLRCSGCGSGKHHRRCSHHFNRSPASPEETVTVPRRKPSRAVVAGNANNMMALRCGSALTASSISFLASCFPCLV